MHENMDVNSLQHIYTYIYINSIEKCMKLFMRYGYKYFHAYEYIYIYIYICNEKMYRSMHESVYVDALAYI